MKKTHFDRYFAEQLRVLDELRERALVIRRASVSRASPHASGTVDENPVRYGDDKPK